MTIDHKDATDVQNLMVRAKRKRKLSHFLPYFVAGGVVTVDHVTKFMAEAAFAPYGSGKELVVVEGWLRFLWFKNTGASFGLLSDFPWLFTILATVVAIGIVIWYEFDGVDDKVYMVTVGMILAGTVGNLLDRIFKEGAVTDFINIPNLQSLFKIFNVADMSLTFGVATILIYTIYRYFKPAKESSES
jgi:signal peptidase II